MTEQSQLLDRSHIPAERPKNLGRLNNLGWIALLLLVCALPPYLMASNRVPILTVSLQSARTGETEVITISHRWTNGYRVKSVMIAGGCSACYVQEANLSSAQFEQLRNGLEPQQFSSDSQRLIGNRAVLEKARIGVSLHDERGQLTELEGSACSNSKALKAIQVLTNNCFQREPVKI